MSHMAIRAAGDKPPTVTRYCEAPQVSIINEPNLSGTVKMPQAKAKQNEAPTVSIKDEHKIVACTKSQSAGPWVATAAIKRNRAHLGSWG